MKILSILLCLPAGLAAARLLAQEGKPEDATARFLRLSRPGPHHEHLAAFAGSYDARMRVAQVPGKEPAETKGTVEARMILDGRFLQLEIRGESEGRATTVLHILGHDNARERPTQLVLSNQSTAVTSAEGVCEEDGKQLRFDALVEAPGSAARMTYRTVYRRTGEGEFALDTFMPDREGKPFLMSEVVCTRRK
ncbi:MAG TPA: DUF1579 family protein [Planctomycetota bacterium]|jgi:hypothetical protein|nr:DUF1579 family protein [Planctomycetota bacterium]